VGLLGVVGHVLIARAFAKDQAARLAPLHYMTLVWSVLIGYLVYAEVPEAATIAGAGLIVLGTLYAQRRK
jgi:S-adenosylmethionine uptake transporter